MTYSRPMPVAARRPCAHRAGGHITAAGLMVCGSCGRTLEDTRVATPEARFEADA